MSTNNKSVFTHLREQNYYLFEQFVFCRVFALSISLIAISLLIQDKICVHQHGQRTNAHFCQNIESGDGNLTKQMEHTKDDVLGESTRFGNYKNIIECLPMVIWSLFVGSFLDNYQTGGTFLILVLNIFGNIFSNVIYMWTVHFYDSSPYYLLVASLYTIFTGGIISFQTTAYRYITVHSSEENRAVKFVVIEILSVIAISLAFLIGGQILINQTDSSILRSYNYNFIVSLIFDFISFVFIYFLFKLEIRNEATKTTLNLQQERQEKSKGSEKNFPTETVIQQKQTETEFSNFTSEISLSNISTKSGETNIKASTQASTCNLLRRPRKNFLKVVFDIENIRQTVHCLVKPRDGSVRLQIYLTYLIFFNQVLVNSGVNAVLLQFVEKAYHWSAATYAIFYALSNVITTGVLALSSLFLVKRLHLTDTTMIVVAQISTFLKYIIIGSYLSSTAYIISLLLGSLSGFALICMRTKLSKSVPEDEIGKIFSMASSLEAMVPIVASLIYSTLFSLSIGAHPGLIYQFSAFLMVLSLVVMAFEYKYCKTSNVTIAAATTAIATNQVTDQSEGSAMKK